MNQCNERKKNSETFVLFVSFVVKNLIP
jgi:hypothetical protein